MVERVVQGARLRVRLELEPVRDLSANPEDYTSRGRIITPDQDRFGAQSGSTIREDVEPRSPSWAESVGFEEAGADVMVTGPGS